MPPVIHADGNAQTRSKTNVKFTGTLTQASGSKGAWDQGRDGTDDPRANRKFLGQPIRATEVGSPAKGEGPAYRGTGRSV